MRILLWHGYLLGGTGSNVYTRALAREWSRAGHDVTVICQEPNPERYDLGGAKVFRPNVGPLLPVFVLDRYEGIEAKLLQDFTRAERDRYVALNATALCAHMPADLVFANHVLLGAPVGVASGVPFVVKAHGSELEYSIRGNDDLTNWARETLPYAKAVYVGSVHIREVLEDVVGQVDRVHEVPPGVDVDEFRPAPREEALQELLGEARADPPNPGNANERHPDAGNAEHFSEFFASDEPTVVYFGKLIYNKGVHILLDALREVDARAVIVGFGDYRDELEPLADVTVVPSIFPEAFGMVAAEAAAAGSPPLVARHSGLAEVARDLEAGYPAELRHLASFATGDSTDLAGKLRELLALTPEARADLGVAARRVAVERWSWSSVSERLLSLHLR
jgi:glycosyltransferase involved in cell wall biosynthesis